MFITNSSMTNFPLHLAGAVSVCQMGADDVLTPFPMLKIAVSQLENIDQDSGMRFFAIPKDDPPNKHLRQTERGTHKDGTN